MWLSKMVLIISKEGRVRTGAELQGEEPRMEAVGLFYF